MPIHQTDIFTIGLRDVRMYAHHGVMRQENVVGNEYRINCSVRYRRSPKSDDNINNTISYADMYEIVETEMQRPSELLETVCSRIAKSMRERWPALIEGEIEIEKTTPPIAGITGSAYVSLAFS